MKIMKRKYDFYIKTFGLYLQIRYDGFYTSMIWYKKHDGKTKIIEKYNIWENYDKFINRAAKIKFVNP